MPTKRGRPKELRGRTSRIAIYLGEPERKAIAKISKKTGETTSEVVRRLVLEAAKRIR